MHATIASREAAMHEKFTDQSIKDAEAAKARRRQVGVNHLAVVLNTALRQRVQRCFDTWIDVLDFETADRIEAQHVEAASQAAHALAAAKREAEILRARADEELIPEIEKLKALNVKQHQQVRGLSLYAAHAVSHTAMVHCTQLDRRAHVSLLF